MKSPCFKCAMVLAGAALAFPAFGENALEYVERRTAEVLKIDRSQIGEWDREKGLIAVVGIAAMENKTPAEIIGKRHELAEIARLLGADMFSQPEMLPVLQELCGALPTSISTMGTGN